MLESILKQYSDIRQLLEDKDQLMHLVEFLTLFKLAINKLEGERYPTIHMVLLWFFKLKRNSVPNLEIYIACLMRRCFSQGCHFSLSQI